MLDTSCSCAKPDKIFEKKIKNLAQICDYGGGPSSSSSGWPGPEYFLHLKKRIDVFWKEKKHDNVGKCRIYSLGPEPLTLGNASRACSSRDLPWKQGFFKIRNHLNFSNNVCFPPCGVVVEGLPAAEAAGVRAVLDVHHVSETILYPVICNFSKRIARATKSPSLFYKPLLRKKVTKNNSAKQKKRCPWKQTEKNIRKAQKRKLSE